MYTPTPSTTANNAVDDPSALTVRIGINAASLFVLASTIVSLGVGVVMLLGSLSGLVSHDPTVHGSPGGLIMGVFLTGFLGWIVPTYAVRLFRKTPLAVFNSSGLWIRTRKNYSFRWQDIGAMYVWQRRSRYSTAYFLSFDPWPSAQVDDMCERMKFKRLGGISCPVPVAARALTVQFPPGVRPGRDAVFTYVRQVAPNVHIEFC